MIILAIDPGESTGIVVMDTDKPRNLYCAIVPLWINIDKIMVEMQPEVVVMESWRLYPHMAKVMIGNEFLPVQVIGVVKYLAARRHTPVILQTAAQAKGIKASEIPTTTSNPHIIDAWRHAEHYRRAHAL